jgi:two-component system CheB/CheR fusion protein
MQDPASSETIDHSGGAGDTREAASVPVVGIGASAGGLDAFTRLLRHLPVDTAFAFVLIQHLDASHPSILSEILARATRMPVEDASDGIPVVPNRIYVIPPNAELTICDRVLRLAPRSPSAGHMVVDRFLQSLALDCGPAATGVVLSGTGSDGVAGLTAIQDAGGLTFAQEPSSAEFPDMPAMAVASGVADLILAPEAIAVELGRIARHPHFGIATSVVAPSTVTDEDIAHLRAIHEVMRTATGVDFSLYRGTTVTRRILRRLALRNLPDLGEYVRLLARSPEECAALKRDLLIGVTSFFRDPEAFDALTRLVFPAIVRDRPADATIRIWVPGCASGEEAYSIVILLQEYQAEANTAYPVQVFGSDVSEAAIEHARKGRYPASIKAHVSPERLRQHFSTIDGSHQIAQELRERCIFSRHDLLDDPPFSMLDLISCRNVLIYLDTTQRKVIPLFHYALVDRGFLMLGRSETVHYTDLFSVVEPGQRIYSRKALAKNPYGSFARAPRLRARADVRSAPVEAPGQGRGRAADFSRTADRILLSRYSPPGVLVDEDLNVLEVRGQPAPYLTLAAGRPSFHLLKLVPNTGLFLEIERLIQEAANTRGPVRRESVPYPTDGRSGRLSLEVIPLLNPERSSFLVLFEASGSSDREPDTAVHGTQDAAGGGDSEVARLSRDLQESRARLVSLLDEHETAEEQSQQITEDALSANEELQSLTEELETAKEELQCTNEELLTVNRELTSRNVALASARDIAKAIVETVAVPLVVVDGDLLVRQINRAFAAAFGVSAAAVEDRPFYELCGGAWDLAAVRARLGSLLAGRRSFDACEVSHEFATGRRVLKISGCRVEELDLILLSADDVTQERNAEEALRRSEEQRRQSEKMEVVGRLAGGIAHDFNNLLTVIIGCAGLVADVLGRDHAAIGDVTEIGQSAEKAAALTDQLLAFSRRKILQPKVFDLNPLLADFDRMLRRLLSEQIKVVARYTTDACIVRADPAEIGRAVMNLCLNARDAMPAGGTLSLQTDHLTLDPAGAEKYGLAPGRYVRLVVADTGLGMDSETRQHVFEPFFTTKDASKGAGLGLASVFGIVQQSGGAVTCESELGEGSRLTVLLLATTGVADTIEHANGGLSHAPKGASEVALLVEDEDSVRRLTKRILERSGYVVLDAKDGQGALSLIESHAGRIDILICDVVMPEMGGRLVAELATRLQPGLKVLFVSGHAEDVILREGVIQGAEFLHKPYTPAELARRVRDVLDAEKAGATSG